MKVSENAVIRADENAANLAHPDAFETKCIKFLYNVMGWEVIFPTAITDKDILIFFQTLSRCARLFYSHLLTKCAMHKIIIFYLKFLVCFGVKELLGSPCILYHLLIFNFGKISRFYVGKILTEMCKCVNSVRPLRVVVNNVIL